MYLKTQPGLNLHSFYILQSLIWHLHLLTYKIEIVRRIQENSHVRDWLFNAKGCF